MNKSMIWRGIFITFVGAALLFGTLMGILFHFYFVIRGLYGGAIFIVGLAIIAIGYFMKGEELEKKEKEPEKQVP
ncbi:MAG TPA: hypothetical protein VED00_01635 [archaeon]|nr:hypothetical protein [archaeon]